MQPLVYFCRWHNAKLRLHGRDATAVWGELAYEVGTPEERTESFRYDLKQRVITLQTAEGEQRHVLDEMGVIVSGAG